MQALIENETHRQQAIDWLKRLPLAGNRKYTFICKLWRRPRTIPQNKYYWLCLHCIADETGNDVDALHEFFRNEFLCDMEVRVGEKTRKVARSTTALTTVEFSEYMEKIHQFSQEFFGVLLPRPDDLGWDSLLSKYWNTVK